MGLSEVEPSVTLCESVQIMFGAVDSCGPVVGPAKLSLACTTSSSGISSAELAMVASRLAVVIGGRMLWHRPTQEGLVREQVRWLGGWAGPAPALVSWNAEPTALSVALWAGWQLRCALGGFDEGSCSLAAVEFGSEHSRVVVHSEAVISHGAKHGPMR